MLAPSALLAILATGQAPPSLEPLRATSFWEAGSQVALLAERQAAPPYRSGNFLLQEAARQLSIQQSPFHRLLSSLLQAKTPAELERLIGAMLLDAHTAELLRETETTPPPSMNEAVSSPERIEFFARFADTLKLHHPGEELSTELERVVERQLIPAIRKGDPPHHHQLFALTPEELRSRPDIPPDVADELLCVAEWNLSVRALAGALISPPPLWVAQDLLKRVIRGQQAMLKLLAAEGYKVNLDILPQEERLGSLDEAFAETEAYRAAEREEAARVLATRRQAGLP
jgi:hypothetical protein